MTRMSKKMQENMDRIIRNIESITESDVKLIPNYVNEVLKDFEDMSIIALERGWDFGAFNYHKVWLIKHWIKYPKEDN